MSFGFSNTTSFHNPGGTLWPTWRYNINNVRIHQGRIEFNIITQMRGWYVGWHDNRERLRIRVTGGGGGGTLLIPLVKRTQANNVNNWAHLQTNNNVSLNLTGNPTNYNLTIEIDITDVIPLGNVNQMRVSGLRQVAIGPNGFWHAGAANNAMVNNGRRPFRVGSVPFRR